MEPWLQALVALAAILYIIDRFGTMFRQALTRDITQLLDKVEELHVASGKTIEPSFELWWENKRVSVAAVLSANILKDLSDQLPDIMPDDMRSAMAKALSEDALASMKSAAFHLAVHAYMGTEDMSLIRKLPKKARVLHEEYRQAHMDELEELEVRLLPYGITADEIEEQFAQAK